jgi:nitrogen fixation protein FixH
MRREQTSHDANGTPKPVTGRKVFLCLVGFFLVVTGVNAVMIGAAVTTFGGVETESSYKAGLAFAREIAASTAQNDRDWKVSAAVQPDGQGDRSVEVVARDAANRPLTGLTARVLLTHPTDRREDRRIAMTEHGPGRFRGAAPRVLGQWDLIIDLDRDGEGMFRSKSRMVLR